MARSGLSGVKPDEIAPYTGGGDYERLRGREIGALKYETESEILYLKDAVQDLFEE